MAVSTVPGGRGYAAQTQMPQVPQASQLSQLPQKDQAQLLAREETAPRPEVPGAGEAGIPPYPQETPAVTRASSLLPKEKDETTTLMERMLEAQKKAKEQKDRFKLPKNTRYGDLPMEAYARLARARTQSQVGAASGYARRQIARLRAEKRQADSVDAPRIQAAINQLQKAVTRAGKKKRDLQKEQFTEIRRKRLEAKQELGKARALRQELRRRQKLRLIREHGYIREAEIDDHSQQQMAATRLEYQTQLESFAGTVPGTPVPGGAAVAAPVEGAAVSAAPAAGGELNIQV